MDARMGGRDKTPEERMRLMGLAVEFGVELAGDKKRMLRQFDDLDQLAVRSVATENEPGFLETLAISVVEFVAVPMSLVDDERSVEAGGPGAHHQPARLR